MRLIISHISALELCSRIAQSGRRVARPTKLRSLRECLSAERNLPLFDLSQLPKLQHRIDVLVPETTKRNITKQLHCHSWGASLPDGSFYSLGNNVYVTSPEFSLLLMSKSTTFNELIALCSEVCGCYQRDDSKRGFYDRPALTSLARISSFLDRMGSASGTTKLARALRYAVENARSPMESAFTNMPPRLGGYGLPKPELNHRIDFDEDEARIAGRAYVELDLFFKGASQAPSVIIEYDSDQEHTGADRIASDSRRNNTLRDIGFVVINLTWAQVRNSQALDAAMLQVAHALDKPLREPSASARAKRAQLRADVLPRIHDMVDAIDTRLVK